MPPPGHQHNFDPRRMRTSQRGQVCLRNLKLWIEKRAVNISRQQPNGTGLRASAFGRPSWASGFSFRASANQARVFH
jgi:hypothetical protein